jgi:hypothetical protein
MQKAADFGRRLLFFWNVTLRSLVKRNQRFGGTYYRHLEIEEFHAV